MSSGMRKPRICDAQKHPNTFISTAKSLILKNQKFNTTIMHPKRVLITGGSGMVGKRLTALLLKRGVEVRWLSTRTGVQYPGVEVFQWNPDALTMDPSALESVDAVFHLAGAPVSQRWTSKHKREIYTSRVVSGQTLYATLANRSDRPAVVVSASGSNYYPAHPEHVCHEDASPARDFVGNMVQHWEAEVRRLEELGIRTVQLRTGMVLSADGGALERFLLPFKLGLGSPLGTGRQWLPWIHIDDLAEMYLHLATNPDVRGPCNAMSPQMMTNREFSKTLARVLNRPMFMPPVPAWILRLVFGEMISMALGSIRMSADKIAATGFEWKYEELQNALRSILTRR